MDQLYRDIMRIKTDHPRSPQKHVSLIETCDMFVTLVSNRYHYKYYIVKQKSADLQGELLNN